MPRVTAPGSPSASRARPNRPADQPGSGVPRTIDSRAAALRAVFVSTPCTGASAARAARSSAPIDDTTTTSGDPGPVESRRATSRPLTDPRCRSTTTRSGPSASTRSTASAALVASPTTLRPSRSRRSRAEARNTSLSSTITTLRATASCSQPPGRRALQVTPNSHVVGKNAAGFHSRGKAPRSTFPRMRGEDLSVSEAAEALGTSVQTVRTLLRKGQLRGERHPWGSRFVWKISHDGLDEFLSEFGRLDGHRRSQVRAPAAAAGAEATVPVPVPVPPVELVAEPPVAAPVLVPEPPAAGDGPLLVAVDPVHAVGPEDPVDPVDPGDPVDTRPFVLRPRGRATVVVLVLGVPLLLAFVVARTLPDALWYDEVGQRDVFQRLVLAKAELRLLVTGTVGVFLWLNLLVAGRDSWLVRHRTAVLGLGAVALAVGGLFASSTAGHWQTYLLWRHRQSFGAVDPVHGKDLGFFVFTLPFELLVAGMLLWLLAVAALGVGIVHAGRGSLRLRPWRATFEAQMHLAVLAALFLLVVGWRLHLQEYLLELQQPSARDSRTFAGAGYVDVHARTPLLEGLTVVAVVLALGCVAAPFVVRWGGRRRARLLIGAPAVLLVVLAAAAAALVPALVQRFTVDPNPLLDERPFLERSISGTREALGLDRVGVVPYKTHGGVTATDFPAVTRRLGRVSTWDTEMLGDRMRQLVTDTPFYRPDEPT